MKRYLKKSLAFLLAVLMTLSAMSVMAMAEEDDSDIAESEDLQNETETTNRETETDVCLEDQDDAVSLGYSLNQEKSDQPEIMTFATVDSGTYGNNITWALDENGVLTITGYGDMEDASSASATPWYTYTNSITRIYLSDGITGIGSYCFMYCGATDVSLPDSLVSINGGAFCDSKLTSVTIPDQVTTIDEGAFAYCFDLAEINLGSGLQSIGSYAFQGVCAKNITIPANVNTMDPRAFFDSEIENYYTSGNSLFTASDGVLYSDSGKTLFAYPQGNTAISFTVPSGITKIGAFAFSYAKNLMDITFPSSVTSFGESAFQNMYKLESFTIPDTVTYADSFIFYSMPALSSITFGSGLTATSYEMLEYCSALTTINFNPSLEELDALTFAYCTSLETVTLPSTIQTIGNGCFGECRGLKTFITEGLTSVPFQALLNCKSLTSVILNEGLTNISRVAFYGCSSLANVTLPASVEFVHFLAFPSTTVITNLNSDLRSYEITGYRIEEDISISGTYMYDMAYQVLTLVNQERNAEGLPSLVMDESLLDTAMIRGSEISVLFAHTRPEGSRCFTANDEMYAENIAMGYSTAADVMDGWMDSEDHKSNIMSADYTTIGIGCFCINGNYYWTQCFGKGNNSTNCTQPSNQDVTRTISLAVGLFEEPIYSTGIIWGAVEGYRYQFSMNLDSSMTVGADKKIQMYVTGNWNAGVSVPINNTGLSYSSSNSDVLTVDNSGTVRAVGSGFATITASLSYSSISQDINVFGENVLACGSCGDNLIWSVTDEGELIIEGYGDMYDYLFTTLVPWCDYVDQITTITISDDVTKIGSYAFYKCANVKEIILPSHLEIISDAAFSGCSGLTSITIPSSVTAIYWYAFELCTGLKSIIFEGSAPYLDYAIFRRITATVYYIPDSTWTTDIMQNYYGTITWVAYDPDVGIPDTGTPDTGTPNTGTPNNGTTGFVQENGIWVYYENGRKATTRNDVIQGTVNGQDGWWYVVGGQVQLGYTGVCDYSNAYGWWYVKNGKVDFGKTGIEPNSYGWWRVVNGQVDFSCNSVEQNDYGWWYVTGGKVDFGYTGVANYANAYGWWYIKGGQVDFSKTSIEPNNFGWWRVVGGKVDFGCNSVEQNNYGWWYVVGGKVDFSYTGVGNYCNDYGWWYISGGKVDFSKTSVEQNNYGWWRVENGKVNFSFTGWATNSYGRWYCVGGKVDFSKS